MYFVQFSVCYEDVFSNESCKFLEVIFFKMGVNENNVKTVFCVYKRLGSSK